MKKINKRGFTLIEVVVVMAIIAVLAVIIVGALLVARYTARQTVNINNAKTIRTAMEAYRVQYRKAPPATHNYDGSPLAAAQNPSWTSDSFEYYATNYLSEFLPISKLSPTSWCDDPSGWGNYGGQMEVYPNGGYTLRPADGNCNEDVMGAHAIIVP